MRRRKRPEPPATGSLLNGKRPAAPDPDALETIGIDLDEVRRRVEATFGPGALERTRAGRSWLHQR